MKKIIILFAAVVMSLSAMAQEQGFYGNKFLDNWYIGVNAGVGTGTTNHALLKNLNFNAGLRLGKLFSPVFGLGIEGNVYFGNRHGAILNAEGTHHLSTGSAIHYSQIGILGTININNAIAGYYGEPRKFEVFFVPAFSWGHNYGDNVPGTVLNTFVNKLAFDFCYNFGNDKQYQLYLEPSINYAIAGIEDPKTDGQNVQQNIVRYNINDSYLQLNLGFIYKFMTSNGTHNFALVESCDQDEIDDLNNAINELREKSEADEGRIVELQKENEEVKQKIDECSTTVPEPVEEIIEPSLPTVFYQVNKAVITPSQESNVSIAAEVLKNHPTYKLIVKGYASPEGGHSNNTSLGVRRADAVKNMLVNKYKISADRITAEGCGETDELFPIYEFNRVAMMYLVKE
ncbi:MAG: OmpA family protein [Prevotella sp.]|nr:OmpA family protein [Candidatus Prevotella equi]